jgi:hypothetical protein
VAQDSRPLRNHNHKSNQMANEALARRLQEDFAREEQQKAV